jgi:hypothetical protein
MAYINQNLIKQYLSSGGFEVCQTRTYMKRKAMLLIVLLSFVILNGNDDDDDVCLQTASENARDAILILVTGFNLFKKIKFTGNTIEMIY